MTILEEIAELKAKRNALILAHNYTKPEIQDIADFVGDSLELSRKAAECTLQHELKLADCAWITDEPSGEVQVKVRSASSLRNAVFEAGKLVFPDGITAAAPGQSAVLYRDDEVLGGGIIESAQ